MWLMLKHDFHACGKSRNVTIRKRSGKLRLLRNHDSDFSIDISAIICERQDLKCAFFS